MLPYLNFLFLDDENPEECDITHWIDNFPKCYYDTSLDKQGLFLLRQAFMLDYLENLGAGSRELKNFRVWLKHQVRLRLTSVKNIENEDTRSRAMELITNANEILRGKLSARSPETIKDIEYFLNTGDGVPSKLPSTVTSPYISWRRSENGDKSKGQKIEFVNASFLYPGYRIMPRCMNLHMSGGSRFSFDPVSEKNDYKTALFRFLSGFNYTFYKFSDVLEHLSMYADISDKNDLVRSALDFLKSPGRNLPETFSPIMEKEYEIQEKYIIDCKKYIDTRSIKNMDWDSKKLKEDFINFLQDTVDKEVGEGKYSPAQEDNNNTIENTVVNPNKLHHIQMDTTLLSNLFHRRQELSSAETVLSMILQEGNTFHQKFVMQEEGSESPEEEGEEENPPADEPENDDEETSPENEEETEKESSEDPNKDNENEENNDSTHTAVKERISEILGFEFGLNKKPSINNVVFRNMIEQEIDNMVKQTDTDLSADQLAVLRYFKLYWLYIVDLETIKKVLEAVLGNKNPIEIKEV